MTLMRRIVLALVAVLMPALPALAADGPTGFRDVSWGATEAALRKTVRLEECYPSDHLDWGTSRCSAASSEKIGDVLPQSLQFYLRDGRLVGWSVLYSPSYRSVMLPAFIARYGKPTKETGSAAEWSGARGRLLLSVAGGSSDYASAVATEEIAKRDAERREQAKKASKGF
jgi:hypothetical protein